ncbi:hypothetical protein SAY86_005974 [Trapa natans]|uniref:DUF868 domain-containing protein n=1 Tax=Trapa natans TaxID=22666 RepID=A0AAN7LCC3_TRANT|nr:hypothetical protein SAY86_005974 [Trapa natans]
MRRFPSCSGENGVQVADCSSSNASKNSHDVVTRVYRAKLRGCPCLITVTWSKNLLGQGLTVEIDDHSSNRSLCKVDTRPWIFSKRKGTETLEACSTLVDVHWDFSSAKFGAGPEPSEGFYVALVIDREMILLLGDMKKEAFKKTGASSAPRRAVLIAKREHIFGKKIFATKAQFCDNGQVHDLVIECDSGNRINDLCLVIWVDSNQVMQVKRLDWKFRGNQIIMVDGLPVEVYWDVHDWLFSTGAAAPANAVFAFNLSAEKSWFTHGQPLGEPLSFPDMFLDSKSSRNLGFSLILHAWKNE